MYRPGLTEKDLAEMATAGLVEEDLAGEDAEVWPENLSAYGLFCALSTQWRIGMAGPTGLDYGAIPAVLRLQRVPRAEWSSLFEDIQVMERQALKAMSSKE